MTRDDRAVKADHTGEAPVPVELTDIETAVSAAAEFAFAHDVDTARAETYARTWFEQGEGLPERTEAALVRALRRVFGIL